MKTMTTAEILRHQSETGARKDFTPSPVGRRIRGLRVFSLSGLTNANHGVRQFPANAVGKPVFGRHLREV